MFLTGQTLSSKCRDRHCLVIHPDHEYLQAQS